MKNESSKDYLNNLDGLRFFAASAVIVHHIEQLKYMAKMPNVFGLSLIQQLGPQAVRFFFVLSGFLITYLLLKERQSTGTVSLRSFYIRRVLRIWPLYYLVVVLGFFLLPNLTGLGSIAEFHRLHSSLQDNFGQLLVYFTLLLPNLALQLYQPVTGAAQCWSLGVEEQFYIIWPILMRWFGCTPLRLLFCVIFFKMALVKGCDLLPHNHFMIVCDGYLRSFSIEAMAAGGIAAYLYMYSLKRETELKTILSICLCVMTSVLAALALGYGKSGTTVLLVYATLIFVAAKSPPLGGIFYAPLQSMGRMSYGLYMLHPTAILICLTVLLNSHINAPGGSMSLALYASSFVVTLLLAYCSYQFFELPFMRLKSKFQERQIPVRNSKQKVLAPVE